MTAELNIQDYKQLFSGGKLVARENQISLRDALATTTAPQFFPKVITEIVREAMEPLLVGTSLLRRVNYQNGQIITYPATGALVAQDIPEGGEYPETSPQRGGAIVTHTHVQKSGLAVKITEEMVMNSQFDLIGWMLQQAGRALARHKEEKIFNYIASGCKIFDNVNPATSQKGVCTGRNLQGAGNGSVTMDDIFDCIGHIMLQGFMPNTILVHPLTWITWVKDPVLRTFALEAGGGTFFANWTGNVNQQVWANALQGGMQGGAGQNIMAEGTTSATGVGEYNPQMNSAPVLPSYLGFPFRIVVSPFVWYDPRRQLTDIYIFDARELGALVVGEDVSVEEFTNPANDIRKIKIKERYGIMLLHEKQQIGVIKNAHIVPNEIVLPPQANIDVSGSTLGTISRNSTVL